MLLRERASWWPQVRPVVAELKRYGVSAAEAGHLDLHRRALLGAAVVAADAALAAEIHGVKKNALYKHALEQQG